MAALYKKGDKVKLNVQPPSGEVVDFAISADGDICYLVNWVESNAAHSRWFKEEELVVA